MVTTPAGTYGAGLYGAGSVPRPFIPVTSPGAYGITTDLWRADRYGTLLSRVDPLLVEAGDVVFNEDATPKRTLSIGVNDPYAFAPFHDWLVPVVTISDPEGNAVSERQGLYLVTPPATSAEPSGVTGTVQGKDGTQLLLLATRDDAVIPAGTDRGAFARQLALETGFALDQVLIPDTGVVQPEDRRWDAGTSVYQIMTDLLTGSNHYAPWADANGRLRTAPYRPLTELAPVWTYTNATEADALDLEGAIAESPDWQRLGNVVTVRKLGHGTEPSYVAIRRNTNPLSPVSIVSLGYEMALPPVDFADATGETPDAIQAALDAHADALLSEAASHYRKLTVPVFPALDADAHQVVGLEITHGARQTYTGRWWRTGWTLHLDGANTSMVMQLARVEEWS